jgi:hypothetical protein
MPTENLKQSAPRKPAAPKPKSEDKPVRKLAAPKPKSEDKPVRKLASPKPKPVHKSTTDLPVALGKSFDFKSTKGRKDFLKVLNLKDSKLKETPASTGKTSVKNTWSRVAEEWIRTGKINKK